MEVMLGVMPIFQFTMKCYQILPELKLIGEINQRELNRWSQFSEQKLRFFSKVKI